MDISIFLPCSSNYHAYEDFKKLPTCHKLTTVFFTAIATVATLGIGSVAAFRYLVGRFTLIINSTNPIVTRTASKTSTAAATEGSPLLPPPRRTAEELEADLEKFRRSNFRRSNFASNEAPKKETVEQKALLDDELLDFMVGEEEVDSGEDSESELLDSMPEKTNPIPLSRLPNVEYPPKASSETILSINVLAQHLKTTERILQTVDNGDCFYDAVAKALSVRLNKNITLKDVKSAISNYVNQYELHLASKGKNDDNWIQRKVNLNNNYDQYKRLVGHTFAELDKDLPIWGDPEIDGRILSLYYGISIEMHEVDENMDYYTYQCPSECDKYGFGFAHVENAQNSGTVIKLGLYRRHYVAIV